MLLEDADQVIKGVGRKVAELRAGAGLTQEQFADVLRMAPNNLQRIELGMQNLTIRTLVRLSTALDVPVSTLFRAPRSRVVRPGRPRSTSKRAGR